MGVVAEAFGMGVLVLSLSAASAVAQRPSLSPCQIRGLSGDVRCGTVLVPEDRAEPGRRQIPIAVVVARATSPDRVGDPFVLLAGGPGQAGTEMGPFATVAFSAVRRRRDLVLIDARGTGGSNPLRCALMRRPEDLGGGTLYPAESVRLCRDSLSSRADLRQYTTENIADDLEAVRLAFGWPALNLYGTSFGSRLALTYLRRHERSVRTMVLKAVAPPTVAFPMTYAADAEVAFRLLERDCSAEAPCTRAFPSVRADLDTVLARADRGDIRAEQPRPGGGVDSVSISRDAIAGTILGALQSVQDRSGIPAVLRQAASGRTGPLAAFVIRSRVAVDGILFSGMHLSVICSGDARRLDVARARSTDDGKTFLGSARVRMVAEACSEWPVASPPPAVDRPVMSRVPVLLVSGELDPNLPPAMGDEALRTLPNGRHVVLRGVSHAWSNVERCGSDFVADFVARASIANLDVACATEPRAPAFVVWSSSSPSPH
jgi:pimeloyl-ACP methyl ester carboxylesterase